MGDRHVYGAKSRFRTKKGTACFDQVSWSDEKEGSSSGRKANPVDVAGKLRGRWAENWGQSPISRACPKT